MGVNMNIHFNVELSHGSLAQEIMRLTECLVHGRRSRSRSELRIAQKARCTVDVQRFVEEILERNCNVYRLIAYRLCRKYERTQ